MRPSLPGTRVVTVPSPFGSTIAGPASGVESVAPVRSFVTLCVKPTRWMTVRVTFPFASKYVVVRRSPTLWIVIGNEHAPPAGTGIVLSTFTSVTAGAVAPAVPAVAAASASTTTMKPSTFAFMLPSFGCAVERFNARRGEEAVANPIRAMRSRDRRPLGVDAPGAAEVEVDHLRVVQQVRAGALEAVAPQIEHVAAV